ncbi:hypothetical protein [Ostreibacterium oceani]|uniref:hypothetical protein n=1 Tax=Ostreibacterium oceani TaxID=2654998 RepID=UPI001C406530|nr:hypothetical protein [Ostreibacterium oceani]
MNQLIAKLLARLLVVQLDKRSAHPAAYHIVFFAFEQFNAWHFHLFSVRILALF